MRSGNPRLRAVVIAGLNSAIINLTSGGSWGWVTRPTLPPLHWSWSCLFFVSRLCSVLPFRFVVFLLLLTLFLECSSVSVEHLIYVHLVDDDHDESPW